jgi:hypothetical protein
MDGESSALLSKLSSSVPGSEVCGKPENCMICTITVNFPAGIRWPEQKRRTINCFGPTFLTKTLCFSRQMQLRHSEVAELPSGQIESKADQNPGTGRAGAFRLGFDECSINRLDTSEPRTISKLWHMNNFSSPPVWGR